MVLHVALPIGNFVSLEVPWKQVNGTLAGLVILSKEVLQSSARRGMEIGTCGATSDSGSETMRAPSPWCLSSPAVARQGVPELRPIGLETRRMASCQSQLKGLPNGSGERTDYQMLVTLCRGRSRGSRLVSRHPSESWPGRNRRVVLMRERMQVGSRNTFQSPSHQVTWTQQHAAWPERGFGCPACGVSAKASHFVGTSPQILCSAPEFSKVRRHSSVVHNF